MGDTGILNNITYTAVSNQNLSDRIGSNNQTYYETACTSLVTDMNFVNDWDGGVFYNANINPDISHWDTSNVKDMERMFLWVVDFNQPLNFDTSSVTDMSSMLSDATSFNQNLSSWNVSSVILCNSFNRTTTAWTLPQPNFTSCSP